MSSGISGQQLEAPLILTWPEQPASYSFGTGNSGVVFTAVEAGADGNDINVNVFAASQDEPLSVEVDGTTITIQPETSGSFDSLSTALEMMNAVNADPEASLLVLGTLADGSNGSEIVEDSGWDHDLMGGLSESTITFPENFAGDGQILGVGLGGVGGDTLKVEAHDNTLELQGDVTGTGPAVGGAITTALADTEVVPGTYTNPVIIVDSKGRITGAADGPASLRSFRDSNATNATTTFASTGLPVTVVAGVTYEFTMILLVANDVPGDGVKIDFNGGTITVASSAFLAYVTVFDTTPALVFAESVELLDTVAAIPTLGNNLTAMIEAHGSFTPNADGTFIPRFAKNSHTTGVLTLFKGASLIANGMAE